MNRVSLFIVDSNRAYLNRLVAYCMHKPDILLSGVATNGAHALEAIRKYRPRVVVLDVVLPGMNGLALIKRIKSLPSPPLCLLVSRFFSESIGQCAQAAGADYLLSKSASPEEVHECILDLVSAWQRAHAFREHASFRPSTVNAHLSPACSLSYTLLQGQSIPPHLLGFRYLECALTLLHKNRMLIKNCTHGLYQEIGAHFGVSAASVERCIRTALKAAFALRNEAAVPSNRHFLLEMLDTLSSAENSSDDGKSLVSNLKL